MAVVSDITDDSFQAEVIDSDIPVIVDFWPNGAPPAGPSARSSRTSRTNTTDASRS